MDAWVRRLNELVWGPGLLALILLTGIYLTVVTGGIQFRRLGKGLREATRGGGGEKALSPFSALCVALSATIGTGNIVGTATALTLGGPGALLWMVVAALLGMATQYAEGFLAAKYPLGEGKTVWGGPFAYIEKGLGARWRPLAKGYAFLGMTAGLLGIGTVTQMSSMTAAAENVLNPTGAHSAFRLGETAYSWTTVLFGGGIAVLAAVVLLGGTRRVARVSTVLVPGMSVLYVGCVLWILLRHWQALPGCVALVVRSAFRPAAALGAGVGVTMGKALRFGVSRGVFSNEAGLGTASIAAAAVAPQGDSRYEPVRRGQMAMVGAFVDTVVLCSLTGLSLLVTDSWRFSAMDGAALSALSWRLGLPFSAGVSGALLACCLIFFAFSSVIGWHYYTERCFVYLFGSGHLALLRGLYILALVLGPYIGNGLAFELAELCNGLLAFPNLVALLGLGGQVGRQTRAIEKNRGGHGK